jgi:hypothetical protein
MVSLAGGVSVTGKEKQKQTQNINIASVYSSISSK